MRILTVLDFLYNSWEWIAIISTLIGVITWLPMFHQKSTKSKKVMLFYNL